MSEIDINNSDKVIGQLLQVRLDSGLATTAEQGMRIRNSVEAHHFLFFYDEYQQIIGYILWADIDRFTYLKLFHHHTMPQYDYEWSEGNLSFIFDVVIVPSWRGRLSKQLFTITKTRRHIVTFKQGRSPRRYNRSVSRGVKNG